MIIKSNHHLDLLKNRRQLTNNKRLTFSQSNKIRKRGYLLGLFISTIGILICSWTSYKTFKAIKYKEKLIIQAEEYKKLKSTYSSINADLKSIYKVNNQIAQGIIGTRSGSALFLELREKLPTTIQIISINAKGDELNIKGKGNQPNALGSINSFQLQLENSFLINKSSVFMTRAWESKKNKINSLNFTMDSRFSNPSSNILLANYEKLGSLGLYKRVTLLKQEGLIK